MIPYVIAITALGVLCVVFLSLWLAEKRAAWRAVDTANDAIREANAAAAAANERLTDKRQMDRSIELILKPFRENLTDFRRRVEEIYAEENRQQGALKNELKNLLELNQRITRETSNLTSALKGSGKVQGDWGEMILERMLESSNLRRGVHYFVQENFKDEHGANLRPDIVLTLPEGKRIVIDSKVSLTAYVDFSGVGTAEDGAAQGVGADRTVSGASVTAGRAGTAYAASGSADGNSGRLSGREDTAAAEALRIAHLRKHVASFRAHIAELHAKNYQTAVADSPDFVIMFVPSEPAFMAALQADSALWGEAYNKKVIVSSPTNLFALLKIVDDLWKRDTQSKNAIEIARQGGALYDKFVGFVETLQDVGRGLDRAQKSYDEAIGQLSGGKGNLVSRTERLRELGVKATKKLPASMIDEE